MDVLTLNYFFISLFREYFKMNDIYTKERQRFVKSRFSPMRVQGVMSKDQLIDCFSVVGGLLLVWVLLSL